MLYTFTVSDDKIDDIELETIGPLIFPDDVKKVVDIPALNVSNAVQISGYVFLKYNALACANVSPPDVDDVVNTELSKIGKFSLGGLYDAIII